MTWSLRSLRILTLACSLVSQATLAQEPTPAPTASSGANGLVGRWTGSAVLTNTAGSVPCRYEAQASPPGVTLEIERKANAWSATLTLDLPAPPGCPAVHETLEAADVVVDGRRVSFVAPDGHSWSLARRQDRIQGLVSGVGGKGNLKLDGEVNLGLVPTPAGAARSAPAPPKGGMSGKAIGAFLAVNVVAAGALVGVNQLGKTVPGAGKLSCSPRTCNITPPSECFCNTQNVTGAACGSTPSGVPYYQPCNVEGGLPCEANLTCVDGLCDARDGACGF